MKKSHENGMNLDLDVLGYSMSIVGHVADESIIYIRTRKEDDKSFIVAYGDANLMVNGLISMLDSVDGAFPILLDVVETYAEEKNIDLATFWDEYEKQFID